MQSGKCYFGYKLELIVLWLLNPRFKLILYMCFMLIGSSVLAQPAELKTIWKEQ